jgi:membrane protease YdiL (CAAX protease family)
MNMQRAIWSYLAVVFALSYAWQLVIYFTGGVDSYLFPVMMLFPGLVAVVFLIVRKESFRRIGWGLRRWWYILPVLVVPLVVTFGVGSLLTTLGWASWSDAHFVFRGGTVAIQGVPMVLGSQAQSVAFFTLNLTLSLLLQSVLGSVVTIGEELGWRGYVLEKMVRLLGVNRGLILLGLVWGYWHLPIILMGYNFPNHPVLGAVVLMPISTIFMGIFLGWLYLRSRSIWMPALAHAAMNLSAVLLLTEITMQRDELFRQVMFIAAWGIVAAFCLYSLNRGSRAP